MPIVNQTLVPNGRLSPMGEWNAVGAGSIRAALISDDAGASYAFPNPGAGPLEMSMQDVSLADSVISVQIQMSVEIAGLGANLNVGAKLAGISLPSIVIFTGAFGYNTYIEELLHPFGGSWSSSDLNDASLYVQATPPPALVLVSYLAILAVLSRPGGIVGIDRAYLTARAGWQRGGASRASFIPTATQGTTASAGLAPGSPGGYYSWRRRYLPQTVWTPVRPPAADR